MQNSTKTANKILSVIIRMLFRVIIYALIILAVIKGVKFAYDFGYNIFYASSVDEEPGRDVMITVEDSMSENDVAKLLDKYGLINNKISFVVQAKFFDYSIKPGKYVLNTSQTSKEMLEILNAGIKEEENTESQ